MVDLLFWWTGGVVWAVVIALVVAFIWLVVRDAFIAAWHLARFYQWGLTEKGKWHTPFNIFWYFFWRSPRFVDRVDVNARVYRPFAKELPEDEFV